MICLALLVSWGWPTQASANGCEVLVVVGLKAEAEVAAGPNVRVIVSAANVDLLRERLAEVDVTRLTAVVSFGIAGALDLDLEVGDLRVASRVVSGDQSWPADAGMRSVIRSRLTDGGGPEFEESVFLGNDVLTGIDAEANRLLREKTGAGVVDMESHVAAAYAQQWRLPFAAIRAISDTAHQEIPPAALVPLLEDGSGDWKGVLGSLIRQPGQLPELWEMVRGFDAAMTTLRATREVVDLSKLVLLPASGPCNASR